MRMDSRNLQYANFTNLLNNNEFFMDSTNEINNQQLSLPQVEVEPIGRKSQQGIYSSNKKNLIVVEE